MNDIEVRQSAAGFGFVVVNARKSGGGSVVARPAGTPGRPIPPAAPSAGK